jgi:hypothetical protein
MSIKRKLIVSAAGLFALGGIGTGVAFARSTSNPSHTKAPTAKTTVADTDNVQQGDQNAPDTPAADAAPNGQQAPEINGQEAPEAKGQETEPANDPEPGHQDPNGVNVDHTPAGEQPEPEAPGAQS